MNRQLNQVFAQKLLILIESRLIWDRHYVLWCEEIIKKSEKPPLWIMELSSARFIGDSVNIIERYIQSEPFDACNCTCLGDFYIACLFCRYQRKEISWATFLKEAGDYADGVGDCSQECEYFYMMLNELEDEEYNDEIEKAYQVKVQNDFMSEIEEAREYHDYFLYYFRAYVKEERERNR